MARDPGGERSLVRRLAWFVALWCGGVLVLGTVAYLLRLAMPM